MTWKREKGTEMQIPLACFKYIFIFPHLGGIFQVLFFFFHLMT